MPHYLQLLFANNVVFNLIFIVPIRFILHFQNKTVIVKYVCKENIMNTEWKNGHTKTNEEFEERNGGSKKMYKIEKKGEICKLKGFKKAKGITLEWTQKIRQNWTWFNKGGII